MLKALYITGFIGNIRKYNHLLGYITGCLGDLLGMKSYPVMWGCFFFPRRSAGKDNGMQKSKSWRCMVQMSFRISSDSDF